MTMISPRWPAHDRSGHRPRRALRPVRLAPWGLYTRYMLWNYVRHILIRHVGAAEHIPDNRCRPLGVADNFGQSPMAWSQRAYAIGGLSFCVPPIFARLSCDRVLPRRALVEAQQTWTRERMTIWNTGRSPMQCIMPVLVLAAGMALIQFSLDAHICGCRRHDDGRTVSASRGRWQASRGAAKDMDCRRRT